jgi:HEAT repeat protein
MPVRREGFSLEAASNPRKSVDVWKRALLDVSASIRELARFHLQASPGFDAAGFYRRILAGSGPSLASISGLGETGDATDLPRLRGFLEACLPGFRRVAVRGLAALGKENVVPELVHCLRDESPGVIRETGRQLAPFLNNVPTAMLFRVVVEGATETAKQTALRLIYAKGKWESVPWLIRAASDRTESVATSARSLLESWFTPPLCNRVFTRPSPAEWRAVEEAVSSENASLPLPFLDRLKSWLGEP